MVANKRLLPIFVVVFVDLLGFSIILPLLPFYALSFGASAWTIGWLVASYSICQFMAAPLLGTLSDRFGRRPVLLYSQVGSLAGFVLLGTALFLPHPLFWIFVSRVIDGVSGGNLTIAQAYISDVTAPEERAKSYGLIGVAFGLGFLVGPAFGGFLSRYGYDVPAYAAAAFSLASIVATVVLLPETEHRPDAERLSGVAAFTRIPDFFREPALGRLLVVFLFFALPFALYVSMFALFAEKQLAFTAERTGYFLAFIGLLGIVWQGGLVGPIVKRFGESNALVVGLGAAMVGQFMIAWVDVWWKLIFVAIPLSFGTSVTRPALTSLITKAAPPKRRGGVLGVTSSLESFSRIVAPVAGGWIIGSLHPTWLGYVGGTLGAVAVALAVAARRRAVV
jgi:DHA1 family tetracycline resistance protein-like MFS transporter